MTLKSLRELCSFCLPKYWNRDSEQRSSPMAYGQQDPQRLRAAVAVLLGLGALGLPVAQRDTPTVSLKGTSLANLAAQAESACPCYVAT